MRALMTAAAIAVLLPCGPLDAIGQRPTCTPWTIPAQTYRAFGDRLVVYIGRIQPQAVPVRVLVGSYRKPFLASTGVLTEASLDKLLAQRRDISQTRLNWTPRSKNTVEVTVEGQPVTVRIVKPTASDVAGEVCGLK